METLNVLEEYPPRKGREKLHNNLRNVVDDITHVDSLESLVSMLLSTINTIFQSNISAIYILEESTDTFYPHVYTSPESNKSTFSRVPLQKCCRRVLIAPYRWPSEERDPSVRGCVFTGGLDRMGFSTWFSLPLRIHDFTIGMIVVGYYRFQYLFDDIGQILWEFAQDVASALVPFMSSKLQEQLLQEQETDIAALYQQERMRRIFFSHRELTNILWADDTLPGIIQAFSQIVGEPTAVLDQYFNPLSVFPSDGKWNQHLTRVKQWMVNNFLNQGDRPPFPIRADCTGKSTFVVGPIQMGNVVLGYLVIWEKESKLDVPNLIATQQASIVLAVHFYKHGLQVERLGNGFQQLFNFLLDKPESWGEQQTAEALMMKWDLSLNQSILVAKFENHKCNSVTSVSNGAFIEHLRVRLSIDYSNVLVVRRRDLLVFILPDKLLDRRNLTAFIDWIHCVYHESNPSASNPQQDKQAFHHSMFQFGLSSVVNSPAGLASAYEEACTACMLAPFMENEKDVIRASDIQIYLLLQNLTNENKMKQFLLYTLDPLIQYDVEHKTELLKTLQAYLKYNGNLTVAAENLFIHRTSLQYRLKRIEGILGRSLESSQVRFELQLAFILRNVLILKQST